MSEQKDYLSLIGVTCLTVSAWALPERRTLFTKTKLLPKHPNQIAVSASNQGDPLRAL